MMNVTTHAGYFVIDIDEEMLSTTWAADADLADDAIGGIFLSVYSRSILDEIMPWIQVSLEICPVTIKRDGVVTFVITNSNDVMHTVLRFR